jgi:hypothetical protein
VLAIQRQVLEDLLHDQPDEEADIGPPPFEHAHRSRRAVQALSIPALDQGAYVLEDAVT